MITTVLRTGKQFTSVSSRKSIINNFTTNRFVELPGKPDEKLNLIYCWENFTSENATINSLPVVVDVDNPDPLPLCKVKLTGSYAYRANFANLVESHQKSWATYSWLAIEGTVYMCLKIDFNVSEMFLSLLYTCLGYAHI